MFKALRKATFTSFWPRPQSRGNSVSVTVLPANSEKNCPAGVVVIQFGRRLDANAVGDERVLRVKAKARRVGRLLITEVLTSPNGALLLRDALSKAIEEAGIIEVPDDNEEAAQS